MELSKLDGQLEKSDTVSTKTKITNINFIVDGSDQFLDTADAGGDVGTIYLTIDEINEIEKAMKDSGKTDDFKRFYKRLEKYAFLKEVMRKVNLEKKPWDK